MLAKQICKSFPYSASSDAKVLILGSMPGKRSLTANQYYAHPQNCFWDIMLDLFEVNCDLDYQSRLKLLRDSKVALWDVAFLCERQSSLDSDIISESVVPNDFKSLFADYSEIQTVYFNGKNSEQLYRSFVLKQSGFKSNIKEYISLPSTSPAHASMSREEKKKVWREELKKVLF